MKMLQSEETVRRAQHQFELFDDFLWYISPHLWTSLAADANSAVAIDADFHGGRVTISTGDVVDNNEAALVTTNELLLFGADASFYAEALLQYTEVNTNGAAVAFGFADAFGANLIADDGGAVGVNSSGVLIYKNSGATVWRAYSENNGVSTDTASVHTAGGSSYQRLGINGEAVSSTEYQLTFFLNGSPLLDSNSRPISHSLLFASATEMDFGVYGKSAGGGAALTVSVDYVYFGARRNRP